MRKYSLFAIFIAILLVLCLPVVSLAAGEVTPFRVNIHGVILNTSGSPNYYAAPVYQVNSTDFCFKPINSYTGIDNIRVYFNVPTGVRNFEISVTCLDTRLLLISQDYSGVKSYPLWLYEYNGGSITGVTQVQSSAYQSQVTGSDGLGTWTYQYSGGDGSKDVIMITIPFAATVMGANSYFNFRVNYFNVNGSAIEDIAITEYNEGFADQIADLAEIEDELWVDVVAPGIDTWIHDNQVAQAMGDYKQVIQAVSMDNFLVPSLIIIVFSFAFYGYALFGRKG